MKPRPDAQLTLKRNVQVLSAVFNWTDFIIMESFCSMIVDNKKVSIINTTNKKIME